jgi:hypothetical protein
MKSTPVRFNTASDCWEVYDLTTALGPIELSRVRDFTASAYEGHIHDLPVGPRREEARRRLDKLRAHGLDQVFRSGPGDRKLVDLPFADHAKTPFSDLGSLS